MLASIFKARKTEPYKGKGRRIIDPKTGKYLYIYTEPTRRRRKDIDELLKKLDKSLEENRTPEHIEKIQDSIKKSKLSLNEKAGMMARLDHNTPEILVSEPDLSKSKIDFNSSDEKKIAAIHQPGRYEVTSIPLNKIKAEKQIRQNFDKDLIESTANSINEHGLLSPIIVRPDKNNPGQYLIVAGERRYRAHRFLQEKGLLPEGSINAFVHDLTDKQKDVIQVIENYCRVNNTPVEVSDHFIKMRDQHGMSVSEITKVVGENSNMALSDSQVRGYLQLGNLTPQLRNMLKNGDKTLNKTAAIAISSLPTETEQLAAYAQMIRHNMTTKQLRNHVNTMIKERGRGFFQPDEGFSKEQIKAKKEIGDKDPNKMVGEFNKFMDKHKKFINKFLDKDGVRLSTLGTVATGEYDKSMRELQLVQDELARVMNMMRKEHDKLSSQGSDLFRAENLETVMRDYQILLAKSTIYKVGSVDRQLTADAVRQMLIGQGALYAMRMTPFGDQDHLRLQHGNTVFEIKPSYKYRNGKVEDLKIKIINSYGGSMPKSLRFSVSVPVWNAHWSLMSKSRLAKSQENKIPVKVKIQNKKTGKVSWGIRWKKIDNLSEDQKKSAKEKIEREVKEVILTKFKKDKKMFAEAQALYREYAKAVDAGFGAQRFAEFCGDLGAVALDYDQIGLTQTMDRLQNNWTILQKNPSPKKKEKKAKNEIKTRTREQTINSPEFKNWFGDWKKGEGSQVTKSSGEPQETVQYSKVLSKQTGEPIIVYHGTTHDFNIFDLGYTNTENHMGRGFYFSESLDDSSSNYAGEGPDLTNRIETLTENLWDSGEYEDIDDARKDARKRLVGNTPQVMQVYLNIRNPIILDTGPRGWKNESTKIYGELKTNGKYIYGVDRIDELSADDLEEVKKDAENYGYDDIEDFFYAPSNDVEPEITGPFGDIMDAVDTVLRNRYDLRSIDIRDSMMQTFYDNGYFIQASDIFEILSNDSDIMDAYDSAGEHVPVGQIASEIFREAGYDGIIYNDASKFFTGMNIAPDTRHFIVWDSKQIKATNAEKFDSDDPNIFKSLWRRLMKASKAGKVLISVPVKNKKTGKITYAKRWKRIAEIEQPELFKQRKEAEKDLSKCIEKELNNIVEESTDGSEEKYGEAEIVDAGIRGRTGFESGSYVPGNAKEYASYGIQLSRSDETGFAKHNYIPENFRGTLRSHQVDFVNLAIEKFKAGKKSVINADGTGSGKTMQEIALAQTYAKEHPDEIVLVLTESDRIINDAFRGDSSRLGTEVNEIKSAKNISGPGVYYATYSKLKNLQHKFGDIGLVVLDESHNLKNYESSQKAKLGIELINKAKHTASFSATPIDKPVHIRYLCEAFGLDFETTLKGLGYSEKQSFDGSTYWSADEKPDEIAFRLDNFFRDLTNDGLMVKREVRMDNLGMSMIEIKLPFEQKFRYDQAYNLMMDEYDEAGPRAKKFVKARGLLGLRRMVEEFKIDKAVDEIKDSLKKGEQVILFAARIEDSQVRGDSKFYSTGTIKEVAKRLEKDGIECSHLYGSRPDAKQQIDNFQSGKNKVIITTPQSGGTGVNLDDRKGDAPRTAIVMTPPFSAMDFIQMIGRVNRLTTKSKAKAKFIITDTFTDVWNKSIIQNKMATLGATVKGEYEKLNISDLNAMQYMNQDEIAEKLGVKKVDRKKNFVGVTEQRSTRELTGAKNYPNRPIKNLREYRSFLPTSNTGHYDIFSEKLPDAVLDFGKYSGSGKRMSEVAKSDPGYLSWMFDKMGARGISKAMIAQVEWDVSQVKKSFVDRLIKSVRAGLVAVKVPVNRKGKIFTTTVWKNLKPELQDHLTRINQEQFIFVENNMMRSQLHRFLSEYVEANKNDPEVNLDKARRIISQIEKIVPTIIGSEGNTVAMPSLSEKQRSRELRYIKEATDEIVETKAMKMTESFNKKMNKLKEKEKDVESGKIADKIKKEVYQEFSDEDSDESEWKDDAELEIQSRKDDLLYDISEEIYDLTNSYEEKLEEMRELVEAKINDLNDKIHDNISDKVDDWKNSEQVDAFLNRYGNNIMDMLKRSERGKVIRRGTKVAERIKLPSIFGKSINWIIKAGKEKTGKVAVRVPVKRKGRTTYEIRYKKIGEDQPDLFSQSKKKESVTNKFKDEISGTFKKSELKYEAVEYARELIGGENSHAILSTFDSLDEMNFINEILFEEKKQIGINLNILTFVEKMPDKKHLAGAGGYYSSETNEVRMSVKGYRGWKEYHPEDRDPMEILKTVERNTIKNEYGVYSVKKIENAKARLKLLENTSIEDYTSAVSSDYAGNAKTYLKIIFIHELAHASHRSAGKKKGKFYNKRKLITEIFNQTKHFPTDYSRKRPDRIDSVNEGEWLAESYTMYRLGFSKNVDPRLIKEVFEA